MTFNLNGYDTLKKEFEDLVKSYTQISKTDKVDDLKEFKKNQLLFLTKMFEQVDALLKKDSKVDAPAIIYGAMSIIIEDSRNDLGIFKKEINSFVIEKLKVCMGITDKSKPNAEQYAHCYKECNNLLKSLVYVDGDSRKGLRAEHPFEVVSLERFAEYLRLGFDFEEKSNNDLLASYQPQKPSGKTIADPSKYKTSPLIPITAALVEKFGSEKLSPFENLKEALRDLNNAELGDKKAADINRLPAHRFLQFHTLNGVCRSLSTNNTIDKNHPEKFSPPDLKDEEKAAILAGLMFITREQIAKEYKEKKSFNPAKIENSKVHSMLTDILKFDSKEPAKNTSVENIETLIRAANHYLEYLVIEPAPAKPAAAETKPAAVEAKKDKKHAAKDAKAKTADSKAAVAEVPQATKSIREKTIFHPKFDFAAFSHLIRDLIYVCRFEALKTCVQRVEESKPKAAASGTGWFSKWGAKKDTSSKVQKEVDELAPAEEKAANTAPIV